MKKVLKFLAAVLFTAVCFIFLQWLFYLIDFKSNFELGEMILEGFVFGLIYTPAYFFNEEKEPEINSREKFHLRTGESFHKAGQRLGIFVPNIGRKQRIR